MKQKNAAPKTAAAPGKNSRTTETNRDAPTVAQADGEQHAANLLPVTDDRIDDQRSSDPDSSTFTPVWIPLDLIDFSPLNYRKYYDPVALQEFSEGLKLQGIISPVTVRVVTEGRYELVVGERRIKGGRLAGLPGTPAVIRLMTDEQVEEAQLAENVGREDSHPIHDAEAIRRMYDRGMTTPEIAARLGKSRTFVYQRRRLCALLPGFQEMFLAGVLQHTEALDIAILPKDAQEAMYNDRCADWKEQDRSNLDYQRIADRYTCMLSRALFDLADPDLYREAGACTVCPHNSGYAGLLFTDEQSDARCGKKACFETKTRLHFVRVILSASVEHQPVALIFGQQVPDMIRQALAEVPATKDLPTHVENDVTLWKEPDAPKREDFPLEIFDHGDGEEEMDEPEEPQEPAHNEAAIDEEAFAAALVEYEDDLAVYRAAIEDGKVYKGFLLSGGRMEWVYFSPEPPVKGQEGDKKVKVADMIKAGTDTPEILEAEIDRIRTREARNQQLDREKVQKQVHEKFAAALPEDAGQLVWQETDRIAARWIAYYSLPYDAKSHAESVLGIDIDGRTKKEKVYEVFSNLTPAQDAYLIRLAMLVNNQSKAPNCASGHFLYKTAEGAGVNVQAIERQQASKAQDRQDNQEVKITLYKKRIKRHRRKVA